MILSRPLMNYSCLDRTETRGIFHYGICHTLHHRFGAKRDQNEMFGEGSRVGENFGKIICNEHAENFVETFWLISVCGVLGSLDEFLFRISSYKLKLC